MVFNSYILHLSEKRAYGRIITDIDCMAKNQHFCIHFTKLVSYQGNVFKIPYKSVIWHFRLQTRSTLIAITVISTLLPRWSGLVKRSCLKHPKCDWRKKFLYLGFKRPLNRNYVFCISFMNIFDLLESGLLKQILSSRREIGFHLENLFWKNLPQVLSEDLIMFVFGWWG